MRSPSHPESNGADLRDRRLQRLIEHTYETVPFHRRRFEEAGIRPADIRGTADLVRLPLLEKRDLVEQPLEEITARGTDPAALVSTMTSGYSGEPFVIYRTPAEQARWARSWLDDLLAAGLRRGDRVASVFTLREGRPDGIGLLTALGFVDERMIDCSLDPETILEDLRRDPPTFLRGLPSVVERVADLVTEEDRTLIRPRVVWLSGEVVTPAARERIEAALGALVHDAYGTHEVGLIASSCPVSGRMHLGRTDLIVEIVESEREAVPTGTGEIVVTALDFLAAPFIRYRLTDTVTPGPDDCPCGRAGPTLTCIEGRTIDYFELPDGRSIHPYRILGPLLGAAPWIRRYQLVQKSREWIVLRYVARDDATPMAKRNLERFVARELGPEVRFEVEAVAGIEPDEGGKSRPIISRVEAGDPVRP